MLPARAAFAFEGQWFHRWELPGNQVWLYIGRRESGYLLRFPDLADFEISGDHISCYPAPANPPLETLKHLLLDQVLPLLLSQRGQLVLHASAVTGPGGAFAFTGASGHGKSTLAASFSLDGYALLTDDCLVVESSAGGIVGTPVYPALRLYPETIERLFAVEPASSPVSHYSSKQRLGLAESDLRFHLDPVRLDRIYILDGAGSETPRVTRLEPREAFMELVRLSFLMDVDDRAGLKAEFENIARLAALPVFRRLSYLRDFAMLPEVRQEILRDAAQ